MNYYIQTYPKASYFFKVLFTSKKLERLINRLSNYDIEVSKSKKNRFLPYIISNYDGRTTLFNLIKSETEISHVTREFSEVTIILISFKIDSLVYDYLKMRLL
jgi:hypothetical protein